MVQMQKKCRVIPNGVDIKKLGATSKIGPKGVPRNHHSNR